jgi:hypothetical protein
VLCEKWLKPARKGWLIGRKLVRWWVKLPSKAQCDGRTASVQKQGSHIGYDGYGVVQRVVTVCRKALVVKADRVAQRG